VNKGDFWVNADQEYLDVAVRLISTEEPTDPEEPTTVDVNVSFTDVDTGDSLQGERVTLNVGNNNTSALEALSTFPDGYEIVNKGDFWVNADQDYLDVAVRLISTEEPTDPEEPTTVDRKTAVQGESERACTRG